MSQLSQIAFTRQVFDPQKECPSASSPPFHESLFRSYHVLRKVREWLEFRVPPTVILELLDHLDDLSRPPPVAEAREQLKALFATSPVSGSEACHRRDEKVDALLRQVQRWPGERRR